MSKYHVSRDGKVRPCRSRGVCPLGTSFDGKASAEEYVKVKAEQNDKYEQALESKESYTMEEALERGAFVEKTVSAQLKNGRDTKSLYFDTIKGEYTEERQKLHREILDELHDKYKDVPSEGKVVFSAGLPGAGKTTVLNMLKDGSEGVNVDNFATVSSDDMKEIFAEKGMIPKVDGLSEMEASTLVHEESSYLADKFLSELGQQNKNIVYDFTCKNADSTTRRMNILKNAGYKEKDMQFIFVDIPLEVAEERANFRYSVGLNDGIQKEGHTGGRYLPKGVLYQNKSKTGKYSSVNAEALLEVYYRNRDKGMPEPIVYDNSGNIFKNPDYKPQKIDFREFASR